MQLFSPIILNLKKHKKIIGVCFCIISLYIFLRNFNYIPNYLSFKNWWWYENLLYYTPVYLLGTYFGMYHSDLITNKEYISKKYTKIGIVLLIIAFILWYFFKEVNYNLEIFYSLIELVGIWFVLKPSSCEKDIPRLLCCNFYIFALHNPILLPRTQSILNTFVNHHTVVGVEMVVIKVIQVAIVVVISMLVKLIVSKCLPKKINYYLTGGR